MQNHCEGSLHAAEGLASRARGESGRNDLVAGMLADVSEMVLPPRVMNCEAPPSSCYSFF